MPQNKSYPLEEDELQAEEDNKTVNEEYKTWKKNAPYLYDLVITHALEWPSLTCQWFPDKESSPNKPYSTHRLLLGTHTSGQSQDYLQIATVSIPKRDNSPGSDKLDRNSYNEERGELGGHTVPPAPRIQIVQKIRHPGEVNRARYMPQKLDVLATKAVSGEILIFDRTKHTLEPDPNGQCNPQIKLTGQTREGYGLAWSPLKAGHILGASEDLTVCHWDINASFAKGQSSINPTNIFRSHTDVVGDVDWHPTKADVFASVGDDRMLKIWDLKAPQRPSSDIKAHEREILCVAFNPGQEHLVITGSADNTIIMHDIRSPAKKLHVFESHTDEVLHLAWSPHNPAVFASASSDRRINIWDLSLIGQEQTPDDQEDGPPELMFIHGGHTARPTDFCWAPGEMENWTAVSASEDNVVMVWQPTMRIWAGDQVKIDEKELESDAMEGIESTHKAGSAASVSGDD